LAQLLNRRELEREIAERRGLKIVYLFG